MKRRRNRRNARRTKKNLIADGHWLSSFINQTLKGEKNEKNKKNKKI